MLARPDPKGANLVRIGQNLQAPVERTGHRVADRFSRLADVIWHTWPREPMHSGRKRKDLSLDGRESVDAAKLKGAIQI